MEASGAQHQAGEVGAPSVHAASAAQQLTVPFNSPTGFYDMQHGDPLSPHPTNNGATQRHGPHAADFARDTRARLLPLAADTGATSKAEGMDTDAATTRKRATSSGHQLHQDCEASSHCE